MIVAHKVIGFYIHICDATFDRNHHSHLNCEFLIRFYQPESINSVLKVWCSVIADCWVQLRTNKK